MARMASWLSACTSLGGLGDSADQAAVVIWSQSVCVCIGVGIVVCDCTCKLEYQSKLFSKHYSAAVTRQLKSTATVDAHALQSPMHGKSGAKIPLASQKPVLIGRTGPGDQITLIQDSDQPSQLEHHKQACRLQIRSSSSVPGRRLQRRTCVVVQNMEISTGEIRCRCRSRCEEMR